MTKIPSRDDGLTNKDQTLKFLKADEMNLKKFISHFYIIHREHHVFSNKYNSPFCSS